MLPFEQKTNILQIRMRILQKVSDVWSPILKSSLAFTFVASADMILDDYYNRKDNLWDLGRAIAVMDGLIEAQWTAIVSILLELDEIKTGTSK